MSLTEVNGHTAPARLPASPRKWLLLVLGVAASVALPVLAFRGVNLAESWQHVRQSHWGPLGVAGVCFLVTLAIRAWRWQAMLGVHGSVAFRPCLSATCVSFLANNILPFRLSDLVRVGVIRQLAGVSAARSLGTVAVERVLDVLTLVLFLGVYLATVSGEGERRARLVAAGWLALAGGLVIVAGLVVGYRWRGWWGRAAGKAASLVRPRLGGQVAALTERVLEGFQVLSSPGQVARMLALSAGLWAVAVAQYYWVGQALGLGLSWPHYAVILFTTALGAIIPAAPGAVGTFESFAWGGLYLVGVKDESLGLAYAAVLHLVEWVLMNLTGVYFLVVDGISLLAAASRGEKDAAPAVAAVGPGALDHPQPV
jgi:uncharacterized protein (TIRG00374 family)